jgi:tRNA (guanine-N7-)-methyltransferase
MPKRKFLMEDEAPEDAGIIRTAHDTKVAKGVAKAAEGAEMPQKRFFRQRAHINPLGSAQVYEYPISPERMDWVSHYPAFADAHKPGSLQSGKQVEVADVGCGFGGLIVGLATVLPSTLMVGMEIRPKVTEYVRLRILALRRQTPGSYDNISVIKTNAMKYLPCFFAKGQLSKLFFCFPDPQFKPSHHRRRIVNNDLLAEYAYVLRPGGRLYTISDVKDLHNWMAAHGDAHPCFERVSDAELADDPCVPIMYSYTEEGKKVERLAGSKHVAVFRRLTDAESSARMARLSESLADGIWSPVHVDYEYTPAASQTEYAKAIKTTQVTSAWQLKVIEANAAATAAAAAASASESAATASSSADQPS